MDQQQRGCVIRIFLPSGSADGIRVIEKSNWTGRGTMCPRPLFSEAKRRDEFSRAGVYVLVGPSTDGDTSRIYVGEGDPIRPRLEQHASKKDFWTWLVAFTSKDENLNKAHVQYLESRLVELAQKANRCELDNANRPERPSLSEADQAEIDGFLGEMLLCFPIVDLPVFGRALAAAPSASLLRLRAKGIEAAGYETAQGFVVRGGSNAVHDEVPSIHRYLSALRRTLLERGLLREEGNVLKLSQDYTFDSPSTAAGVLLGRAANGRIEWKDDAGRTLKEIQEEHESGG